MKKIALVLVVVGFVFAALAAEDITYPKVKMTGKIYSCWTMMENNMSDFAEYDDATPATWAATNDSRSYAQARVDVNFSIDVAKNVYAKVATRVEASDGKAKWLYFGKTGNNDELKDAKFNLQEAYVELKNLFNMPLFFDLGRKAENFGAPGEKVYGNVMSTKDKVDGWKLGYDNNMVYGNLHYYIMQNLGDTSMIEGEHLDNIIGINGGVKDMMFIKNANLYLWMRSSAEADPTDLTEEMTDSRNVVGLRVDTGFMEDMFTPFIEFAIQSGTDEAADMDYSAMLLDLGTGFDKSFDSFALDAGFRYLMPTGDDYDTADKDETFTGIGLGNWEEGWMWTNPLSSAGNGVYDWVNTMTMLKVSAGITPASLDKFRLGVDFWMYSDASKNVTDISGENVFNELGVCASYAMNDNVDIMLGYNMVMPNKDVVTPALNMLNLDSIEHGDSASALWFETDVRW